jgi:acyl-CoA reductase-like NAD-dependent aldehyde dehydrogenase
MEIKDRFQPDEELSADVRGRFYIDGTWVEPATGDRFSLISPVTEEVQLTVPAGAEQDMAAAVAAARQAFDRGGWSDLSARDRAPYLRRMAEEVTARMPLLKRLWTAQVGAPVWVAEAFLSGAAAHFELSADLANTYPFEEERQTARGTAKIIREPVGVCALIVPWNAPLYLLTQKLAAALISGCTVVIKPSPETPLDALVIAECAHAAGFPRGVVNVVPADRGPGDWLVRRPEIDKVSFTGSTAAGKHIAAVCADRVARVSLELGGKSASIFCEDADVSSWIENIAPFTMPLSGQACWSQTRVLVPTSRKKELVEALAGFANGATLGDPWEMSTQLGPLASARQKARVLDYIEIGKSEGARAVTGGGSAPNFNRGYFVSPTIFDGVTNDMRIAREEIFGPVVSVIEYRDEEDAIRIANDSDYGLSGSVFSQDQDRAERIARRIRTGNISVNALQIDPAIPFGGFKQSGIGREAGPEGLEPYLETKVIYFPG